MASGDRIVLGSAATGLLVPAADSHIATDDFGIQRGVLRHLLGNQALAQSRRFAIGSGYTGTMPQFSGFFVEKSGDILGGRAGDAILEVTYARLDPNWIVQPKKSHDLQLVQVKPDTSGLGQIQDTLMTVTVPIPHTVITLKFSQATAPGALGTYGTPAGAPTVPNFLVHMYSIAPVLSSFVIEEKTVTGNVTLVTINPDGTCTSHDSTVTATLIGIFPNVGLQPVNMLDFNFVPDPSGWLCLKEESQKLCNGNIYAVEQQWKRTMMFAGSQPGTWWQGARQLECS